MKLARLIGQCRIHSTANVAGRPLRAAHAIRFAPEDEAVWTLPPFHVSINQLRPAIRFRYELLTAVRSESIIPCPPIVFRSPLKRCNPTASFQPM